MDFLNWIRRTVFALGICAVTTLFSIGAAGAFTAADNPNAGGTTLEHHLIGPRDRNGLCAVFIYFSATRQPPMAIVEIDYGGNRDYAGGSFFRNAWSYPEPYLYGISVESLADCLETSVSNISEFNQDGAQGTFATDNYIGFSFTLASPTEALAAGRHEFSIGSGGASNALPVADAGTAQAVVSGTQVTLSGTGTDSDGNVVSYAWTRTGGSGSASNATLSSAAAQNTTFTDSSLTSSDAAVTHVFSLVVTDDVGAISSTKTVVITINPPLDITLPDVVISDAPASISGVVSFTASIRFSEPVSGFSQASVAVTNGSVTSLTGSGARYSATILSSGTGDVQISVLAGAAMDGVGNLNTASLATVVENTVARDTQEAIAKFQFERANQLLAQQPDLTRFLAGKPTAGAFRATVTRDAGTSNFTSKSGAPILLKLSGSWTSDGTSESNYFFGAIGTHRSVSENLLLGALLEFDHQSQSNSTSSLSGDGWMIGPYFVAKAASSPLFFEGRLLFGETSNKISPTHTYTDRFNTERSLVQFKMRGQVFRGATELNPFASIAYTNDRQLSYLDGLGNTIPSQTVSLGQGEFGLDFVTPIKSASGKMSLSGGVSGIYTHSSGTGVASTVVPSFNGGRAKVKLGVDYLGDNGQSIGLNAYYDGIGAKNYETFGFRANFGLKF